MALPVLLPCVTRRCDSSCCDAYEVPLLESDVQRLAAATGRPSRFFVDEADGWRLLRGAGVATDGCVFLGPVEIDGTRHRGCTVHEARPEACRTYPFVLQRGADAQMRIERDGLCPYAAEFDPPPDIAAQLTSLWARLRAERVVRRAEGRRP